MSDKEDFGDNLSEMRRFFYRDEKATSTGSMAVLNL
jgi:hypothetical protein